jgi:hypothetical protein
MMISNIEVMATLKQAIQSIESLKQEVEKLKDDKENVKPSPVIVAPTPAKATLPSPPFPFAPIMADSSCPIPLLPRQCSQPSFQDSEPIAIQTMKMMLAWQHMCNMNSFLQR